MRSANSQRTIEWAGSCTHTDNIIYFNEVSELPDYRAKLRRKKRRGESRADAFWNLLYVVACLSVLVVLFLH